jgi:ketosteroid isomerase-like protein
MSEENVEAFKRGFEAINRGDVEAALEELDPDVEWHPAVQALVGGEATVYLGHAGVREMLRDLWEAFAVLDAEYPEIRDLGDRCVDRTHPRSRERKRSRDRVAPGLRHRLQGRQGDSSSGLPRWR